MATKSKKVPKTLKNTRKINDFGRRRWVPAVAVAGGRRQGRAWSNPSFGRIFEEDRTSSSILNTPLTHQGGLADLRCYTHTSRAVVFSFSFGQSTQNRFQRFPKAPTNHQKLPSTPREALGRPNPTNYRAELPRATAAEPACNPPLAVEPCAFRSDPLGNS